MSNQEPKSWAEYANTYRDTFGSRSYSSAAATEPQVRFCRSVAGVCPLSEIKHPLYAIGSVGHTITPQDGSYQRAQWHGWGDVSLLKEEGYQGQQHPRGVPKAADGKKSVGPPASKDGRKGLFGVLQGTEAGGPDAWLGHLQIDPTKGKRAVSAPTDDKGTVSLTQLLAQTAPGTGSEDAWIGNIAIDPAKGKGHAQDPSSLRGRADLFAVLQQQVLREAGSSSSSSGGGGGTAGAADADAWIGNRMIQPNKGKKAVELSETFQDHLFAATFKAGPPIDGCWSDMPPVGKRPLQPPSAAAGFVTAQQAMRTEEALPPGAVLGRGKPEGKGMVQDPHHHSSKPHHVDVYSVMTFQPLTDYEADRYKHAWNDSPAQPKKKLVPTHPAAADNVAQQPVDFQPNRTARYVPLGGIAQEKGMTLNTIIQNRAQGRQLDGSLGSASGSSSSTVGKQRGSTFENGKKATGRK